MKKIPPISFVVLLSLLTSFAPATLSAASSPEELARDLKKIALSAGGTVGVRAVHLGTGEAVSVDGAVRFPMASVFKLPIAVLTLHRVDIGKESLERLIPIRASDLRLGVEEEPELAGQSLSVRELLERMLLDSDNTSCDVLLREEGGPKAVEAYLGEIGVAGIDVSWSELDMASVEAGFTVPPESERSLATLRKAARSVSVKQRRESERRFEKDTRNTATPEAAALLLRRVSKGEALKADTNALLLDMLRRCRTGAHRIRALLPGGTEVFDKTGTTGRTTNDIGLVTLPNGAGQVAVAVFVKGSPVSVARREKVIARIARAVYDYYSAAPSAIGR